MAGASMARGGQRGLARGQPTSPSAMGVWITDAVLAQAVERYHRTFSTQCRHITFRPGPLESRRRANKRNMAVYMPQTSLYSPGWNFDVQLPDSWKWEAPTSPEHRREKREKEKTSLKFACNSFMTWLEGAQADQPFLTPPAEEDEEQVQAEARAEAEAEALNSDDAILSSKTEALSLDSISTEVRADIQKLQAEVSATKRIYPQRLLAHTRDYASKIGEQFAQGRLSADEAFLLITPFDAAASLRMADFDLEYQLNSILFRAWRLGIRSMSKAGINPWSDEAWLQLLKRVNVLALRHTDPKGILGRQLISVMPAHVRFQLPNAVLFPLYHSHIRYQSTHELLRPLRAKEYWSWHQRFQKLSAAQSISFDKYMIGVMNQRHMYKRAAKLLVKHWTPIKARLQRALDDPTAANDPKPPAWTEAQEAMVDAVDQMPVSNLLNLDPQYKLKFYAPRRFGNLWCRAVWGATENSGASSQRELAVAIRKTGKLQVILDELSSQEPDKNIDRATEWFVKHCNDARMALEIFLMLKESRCAPAPRVIWPWDIWADHVEELILHEDTETTLFEALYLTTPRRTGQAAVWFLPTTDPKRRIAMLERMSAAYMRAPHLNNRQRLRRLSTCLNLAKKCGESPPTKILACVVDLVLSGLEEGTVGGLKRLQWLVQLIGHHEGPRTAENSRRVLQNWRAANARRQGIDSVASL